MSTAENKAIAVHFYEEFDRLKGPPKGLCAPGYIGRCPPTPPMSVKQHREMAGMLYSAFPDLKLTIEDTVAEGDKVTLRYTLRGTHKGELMGIPPTGKQITVTGNDIVLIVKGKVKEMWGQTDMLGLMQQIGAIPTE